MKLNKIKKLLSIILLAMMCFSVTVHAESTYSEYTDREYKHNEKYENSLIINGVDVSNYQNPESDWKKAKASGIDFSIIRITLTHTNTGNLDIDKDFEAHYTNAGEAGIMRGVYVFSQARNSRDAEAEAEFAIKRLRQLGIEPKDLELPIYMDYEFYDKSNSILRDLTRKDAIEAANTFCDTIKKYGYKVGVYANTSFFASYLDNGKNLDNDVDIWCAQYSSKNYSGSDYSIWQYNSEGKVPDIYAGNSQKVTGVDVDFWYIDTSLNKNPKIKLFCDTNVEYTGEPVVPNVELRDGKKTLIEGEDYIVSGINNVDKGSEAYAYIQGIGDYSGYALIPINIGQDFLKLDLPTSIIETDYRVVSNSSGKYINIPDNLTVKEFLENVKLTSEEYTINVIDREGNAVPEDKNIIFSDMVGVFSGDSLLGTINITTDSEYKINYLKKK